MPEVYLDEASEDYEGEIASDDPNWEPWGFGDAASSEE